MFIVSKNTLAMFSEPRLNQRQRSGIMQNKLMTGVWRYMLGVPPFLWEKQIREGRAQSEAFHWIHDSGAQVGTSLCGQGDAPPRQAHSTGTGGPGIGSHLRACVGYPARLGKAPDLLVHKQRWTGDLGLSGNSGENAPFNNLSFRGAVIRCLSGGRIRDALRARATER